MIRLTILGEAASKANSREIVTIGTGENKRFLVRKSDKGLAYEANALKQIPPKARQRLEGPLRVTMRIFYASERPDLDESLILDCLQDRYAKTGGDPSRALVQAGVYCNDRQVRERHTYHAIDKRNPRAEIVIEPIPEAQDALPLAVSEHPDVALLRQAVKAVDDARADLIINAEQAAEHADEMRNWTAALDRINAELLGI